MLRAAMLVLLAQPAWAAAASSGEVLRQSLLSEAAGRIRNGTIVNGKFALSTGAWYMTDEYVKARQADCKADKLTGVAPTPTECTYRLDVPLVRALAKLFIAHLGNASVTELGAGIGRYRRALLGLGVRQYTAFDGMPDVDVKSHGAVGYADLSQPCEHIVRSDFGMSLEVAEHIPPQFEATFLDNLDRANERGVIVSWSAFKDTAHGHVNAKSASAAQRTIEARGYVLDRNLTRHLRKHASFPYLRRTIMLFRRRGLGGNATV